MCMNLREARREWKRLGGSVEDKNRTGEEVYRHLEVLKPITVNKRRTDAPRKVLVELKRLRKQHRRD